MVDNQLIEFLIYIVSGIAISILFDVFRVLRKSIKTSNLITYVEDAVFWVIVGAFLIWEIFTISYGELRSYMFIGLLLGIVGYLLTLSKFFIKVNVKILNIVKSCILKIIYFFKHTLNFIGKIIKPILIIIKKPIYFLCINYKKLSKGIVVKAKSSKRISKIKEFKPKFKIKKNKKKTINYN